MKSDDVTSIRQAYKDQTRERILDAAIALMADDADDVLTIAGVATRAGVTERTVYRHFGSRDELVEAVWPRMQARVNSRGFPRTAKALVATPPRLFPNFDRDEGLVRASLHSTAGREVRQRSNPERQEAFRACIADALPTLSPEARERRAAAVQVLDSAAGWAMMKDFWGFEGEQSGRAAAEAIAILLGLRSPLDESPIPSEEESQ